MHRRDFIKLGAAIGAVSALPLWSRAVFAAERATLPIPALLTADANNQILLNVQSGKTQFGGKTATTWGYNGSLLGPAIQLEQWKPATVKISNSLAEETTVHWHGLEVSSPELAVPSASRQRSARRPVGSTRISTEKPGIRSRWGWQGWC